MTVIDEAGIEPSYTVAAVVHPTALQTSDTGGNYSATFKAMLRPHKAPGGAFTIKATCNIGCFNNATRDHARIERVTWGDVYFCGGQSNMALPLLHTFAGLELQQEMRSGAYKQLRFFTFGGMSVNRNLHSTKPVWARTDGAVHYYNKTLDDATHTWFNASFGASIEPHCCYSHNHISWGPLLSFSATCLEFGRQLIEQLGNETAPPIGLIQSAVGGTQIEAWSPNATTAQCQNKTAKGPTSGSPNGFLFYGMVCPFVNMTIAGWTW